MPHFSSKIRLSVLLIFILAVVFLAYLPVLQCGFVFWDDDVHLFQNIAVQTLDAEHLFDIFRATVNKIYIPLTTLSYALEHHFFGMAPFVYHLDNLFLHLAIVGLIFVFGLRLGLSPTTSWMGALLFGIHPIHVESVAWVTERKDVLYAFFYMAALLSYLRYLRFTTSTQSFQIRASYRFLVLATFLGVMSMLAKPMALSLPLILLWLDWFHGRKIDRSALLEKVPLALVIAGMTLLTYMAHARIPGKGGLVAGFLTWTWTLIFYLRQFLFPFYSVPLYQLPKPVSFVNPEYCLSVIILGLLVVALVRLRKYRWFIFSFGFFFFSIFFLLRYDEIKDANVVADRFMYLPSLGFCFLLALGVEKVWQRRWLRPAVAVVVLLAVGLFSRMTFFQAKVWHDSVTLWNHQLSIVPDEPIALNNLAAALREQEDYKEAESVYRKYQRIKAQGLAIDYSVQLTGQIQKVNDLQDLYQRAIQANPGFLESYYNLGNLFRDVGKIPEAIEVYKKALTLDYRYKDAHFSLGELYQRVGDEQQAVYAYDQVIAFNADDEDVYVSVISAYNQSLKGNDGPAAYQEARARVLHEYVKLINRAPSSRRATSFFNLGYLYGEMGDFKNAVEAYQTALDIQPNHSKTHYNLGNIYKDAGRLGDALVFYKKAASLDPKNSDVFVSMGAIFVRQGMRKEAREHFERALRMDPNNSRAYFDLAYLEEMGGDIPNAIKLYAKSAELDPKNRGVFYNLGNVYARAGKNSEAIRSYLKATEQDPEYMDAWINLSILSFKEGRFSDAVKYCNEAMLLGYVPPPGFANALEPYRAKDNP